MVSEFWDLKQAVEFCKYIRPLVETTGCHVALTGGTLYNEGLRKDIDIVIYGNRQNLPVDIELVKSTLKLARIEFTHDYGFVHKVTYHGKNIDFLFPEYDGGDYGQ